jgi:pyruvate,orthophosphate dikinase
MGKVCVVGCGTLSIDYERGEMTVDGGNGKLRAGDAVSIDGFTGEVFAGEIPTKPSEVVQVLVDKSLDPSKSPVFGLYAQVMKWADQYRRLGVRANADLPEQCEHAVAFGAEGVGLCRTEHMFFGEGKIEPMREMILAETPDERRRALAKLLPLQRADFEGIFRVLAGKPVTIRLIDPPLHEFLPHDEPGQREVATDMGVSYERVHARVEQLHEFNPMLGFRGCRLGIIYPEITRCRPARCSRRPPT